MVAIARYALKSPFHAATMVGVLGILSLFIPLVSILSGGIVGLIILTQGLMSGARVILVAMVGISIISYAVLQSAMLGFTLGLVQWLPVMLLAEVWRRFNSLSLTILTGMAVAMMAVVVQFAVWPDSEQFLFNIMQKIFQGADNGQSGIDMQQLDTHLQAMAHWTVILLMAVMYGTFIATVMIGRWFQARIAGSTGYRDEFYAIRLGQGAALVGLVLLIAVALLQLDWLMAMLMIVLSAFVYQGLSIAHQWAASRKHSRGAVWLGLIYFMMIIIPQVIGLTAIVGMLDNWMNFRSKFDVKRISSNDD